MTPAERIELRLATARIEGLEKDVRTCVAFIATLESKLGNHRHEYKTGSCADDRACVRRTEEPLFKM